MSIVSNRPVGRTVSFLRTLVGIYRDRNIPFMAGSIAYSAFVSLIPLVLLSVIAATAFGGVALQQRVLAATERYLTSAALDVVDGAVTGATARTQFSVLGGVALLWSVLKVFRTLDTAFTELYGDTAEVGLAEQIQNGVAVLGAMATAVLAMLAVGAVLGFATSLLPGSRSVISARLFGFVALLVALTVAFLPMYYVYPSVPMTVRESVPGAAVAAVGWTALQGVFQIYVSLSSASRLYGVIGGVLLFLTWLYFGAVILLLGGATNVALSGRDRFGPGNHRTTPRRGESK